MLVSKYRNPLSWTHLERKLVYQSSEGKVQVSEEDYGVVTVTLPHPNGKYYDYPQACRWHELERIDLQGFVVPSTSFSAHLKCLSLQKCHLTSLPLLPEGLVTLWVDDNELTELPPLPASLVELGCSTNKLTKLPPLHLGIEDVVCFDNPLSGILVLPKTVQELWCSHTNLQGISGLPSMVLEAREMPEAWLMTRVPAALFRGLFRAPKTFKDRERVQILKERVMAEIC